MNQFFVSAGTKEWIDKLAGEQLFADPGEEKIEKESDA